MRLRSDWMQVGAFACGLVQLEDGGYFQRVLVSVRLELPLLQGFENVALENGMRLSPF